MSFWKVLGGAALGALGAVVSVATGGIAAPMVVAALAGAAAGGGAAAAAVSKGEEPTYQISVSMPLPTPPPPARPAAEASVSQPTTGQPPAVAAPPPAAADEASVPPPPPAAEVWLRAVPEALAADAAQSIPVILQACSAAGVTDSAQVAYILATAQHESGFGHARYSRSQSLLEDHNPFTPNANDGSWSARNHVTGHVLTAQTAEALERTYWNDAYGNRLGNRPGSDDGYEYRGRGYVQLTGRSNYEAMSNVLNDAGYSYTAEGVTYGGGDNRIDLVAHPNHVSQVPELAARILVEGMMQGTFTGAALPNYVNENQTDFQGARRVVNGTDRAQDIAEVAQRYNNH